VAFDITRLKRQVQHNCDISDANYGGMYSLCGLFLRLREYYKWAHGLLPWQEPESAALLEWVEAREKYWEEIAQSEIEPLVIGTQPFDPFDMAAVNARLRPCGLVYGAGYVSGMKPSFFLAESIHSRKWGELDIDIVGGEIARDLFITPAMRQGNQIFARRKPMLSFLWDQLFEMRPSVGDALTYGMAQHGLDIRAVRRTPGQLSAELERVASIELDHWIHHEIGEVRESVFKGDVWHEIVAAYAGSPIEIFARVLKDLLADTHMEGFLGHVIRNRIKSSLGFYVAFLRPFTKLMFPELPKAFEQFRENSEDWSIIEEARSQGYSKIHDQALALIELHEAGRDGEHETAKRHIISTLIEPLGILAACKEDPVGDVAEA
jgi:hypothetical protein